MRILVRHPVPVRWTPPRAKASRVSAQATVTPVEIPELPSGTIGRDGRRYVLPDDTDRDVLVHAGRCWRTVHPSMVGVIGDPMRNATAAEFAAHLGTDRPAGSGVVDPLTPLRAGHRTGMDAAPRGEDLPDAILARAHRDNTEPARAALRAWMAGRFAVQDGLVYAVERLPRLAPHSGIPSLIDIHEPDGLRLGPSFEPARFHAIGPYMRAFGGYRGDWRERVRKLEGRLDGLPYPGDDLRVFLQDGPAAALRLLPGLSGRIRAAGRDPGTLAPQLARLEPWAELGAIGAIAPEDIPVAASALSDALDAIAALAPADDRPAQLRMLRAYLSEVALPGLAPGPVDETDAAALSALGPAA